MARKLESSFSIHLPERLFPNNRAVPGSVSRQSVLYRLPGSSRFHEAIRGFRFPAISLGTPFKPDNPAATPVIRSLVLLGARSDAGEKSYKGVLLRSASSVCGARQCASSWPAGTNTHRPNE